MNKFSMASKYPTQSALSRRENGNNLWQDAIAKEMKNTMVAFEVKNQARNAGRMRRYSHYDIHNQDGLHKEGRLALWRTHDQTT
jgi:hypothetical protein